MGKDKRARADNRLTAIALANLVAAIVDTMQNTDLPDSIVHHFLDELDRLNTRMLPPAGAGAFMHFITDVLRGEVVAND